MESSQEDMLAANALIHQHGDGAEEYIARQLWDSRQKKDKTSTSRWQSLLEALRRVRELRARTKHES
jgi:hypothetical protein